MIDFSAHKFHPSQLGRLMTNDRSGKNVGETCKAELLEIWIEATYDRCRDFTNKYTEKGTLVEEDSITLYSKQKKKFYKKNIETFENKWFIGTPDIITPTEVIDIKSSWSLFTFYDNIQKTITGLYVACRALCGKAGVCTCKYPAVHSGAGKDPFPVQVRRD
jgi:hypothetical protein